MAKPIKGVSGRTVTSRNAIRKAEAAKLLAKSRPGRPPVNPTHPQLSDPDFLKRRYAAGLTLAQIGVEIGVSKEIVRKAFINLGIDRREKGKFKSGEHPQRRKRIPFSPRVLTIEQRRLPLLCPTCNKSAWYQRRQSDTFLCNICQVWFDVTLEGDHLVATPAQAVEVPEGKRSVEDLEGIEDEVVDD